MKLLVTWAFSLCAVATAALHDNNANQADRQLRGGLRIGHVKTITPEATAREEEQVEHRLSPSTATRRLRSLGEEEVHKCDIVSVARDYYTTSPEHDAACIDSETGEFLDLDLPPDVRNRFRTGDTLTVRGERRFGAYHYEGGQDALSVTSWEDHESAVPPGPTGRRRLGLSTGLRSAVVLQIRFVDSNTGNGNVLGSGMDTVDKRKAVALAVNNTLFGTYDRAVRETQAGIWEECSYGKLKLDFDVDGGTPSEHFAGDFPGDGADIFYVDVPVSCRAGVGYCTRTYDTTSACGSAEYYGWPEYALNKLEATVRGFSRSTWQHRVVVFDKTVADQCTFGGQGNLGCDGWFCYSWVPHDVAHQHNTYTHEMGHNLNLGHAGLDPVTTGAKGKDLVYGDFSCSVADCCEIRCYNGPHAYEMGWLPALEVDSSSIQPGTDTTHVLNSMSLTDEDALISIAANWPGGDGNTYWLQFKTAHSYDAQLDESWRDNVQIKLWNNRAFEPTKDLGEKLTAGQSWTEPSGEITVTVQDIDTTDKFQATLNISRKAANCARDRDCDDGILCTADSCRAGRCVHSSIHPKCDPETCGKDGCDGNDTRENCPWDCIVGDLPRPGCNRNGICDEGEHRSNCPSDCTRKEREERPNGGGGGGIETARARQVSP